VCHVAVAGRTGATPVACTCLETEVVPCYNRTSTVCRTLGSRDQAGDPHARLALQPRQLVRDYVRECYLRQQAVNSCAMPK